LCYNKNGKFFTIELKVSSSQGMRFSPHQISFHIRHPKNSFILEKPLGPCSVKLYEGSDVIKLHDREPCSPVAESWPMVQEHLVNVT
jgi:hypothetical protein